jgi:hypothetical protein
VNLFILDEDPQLAAEYHCDRHVIRAILDVTQALSAAHIVWDGIGTARERIPGIRLRSETHTCSEWVRQNHKNYEWAWSLLDALTYQYELRFNVEHKFVVMGLRRRLHLFPFSLPAGYDTTPFVQCMPPIYQRDATEAVEAYREYYWFDKRRIATWKPVVDVPYWWREMEASEHYHQGEMHVGA